MVFRRPGTRLDSPSRIVSALTNTRADIYITSGGASVGDHDFSRVVLEQLGGRKVFWQVAIRPGRPILFGVVEGRAPILYFALPGNPGASALTSIVRENRHQDDDRSAARPTRACPGPP